jgi:hypothetical protein
LEQVKLGNVFIQGEPVQFRVNTPRNSLKWQVYDLWGKKVLEGNETIPDGGMTFTVPLQTKGYYELKAYVEKENKPSIELSTSFAVLSNFDVKQVDNSFFGVATHLRLLKNGWGPDLSSLIGYAGAKNIRDEAPWSWVENVKGVYSFSPEIDNFMKRIKLDGIKPFLIFSYENKNYDNNSTPYTDDGRQGFANYGKALLDHYGDQMEWVEVYNEFNHTFGSRGNGLANSKAEYYFPLLKKSYETVKAAYPNVKVVGGATADIPMQWLETLFSLGGLDYMDALSIHPYRYPRTPEGMVDELNKLDELVKKYNHGKSKPIWISEMGWPTQLSGSGVDEKTQSEYLVRSHVLAMASGVEKFFWYDFMNDGTNASYNEDNFGIIRNKSDAKGMYAPKPAYVSYSVMTRQLTGAQFIRKDSTDKNIYSYLYRKSGEDIRAVWSLAPMDVTLKTSVPITVTDLMGNDRTYVPYNGEVYLSLTGEPVYIKGDITDIIAGSIFTLTGENAVIGENINVKAAINNSTASGLTASFEIDGNKGTLSAVPGGKAETQILLPAQQEEKSYEIAADVTINGVAVGRLKTRINITKPFEYKVRPHILDVLHKSGALQVNISNLSKRNEITLSKIEWTFGGYSGTLDVSAAISPASSKTIDIQVPSFDYGVSYPATVKAYVNGAATVLFNGNLDFNPAIKRTVDVNGSPDESSGVPHIDISTGTVKISKGYNGPDDLSGDIWVNWDEEKFYLTAKIKDDIHAATETNSNIWKNDSMQFAISSGVPGEAKEWYEYGISDTPLGPQIYRWLTPVGVPSGLVTNGQLTVARDVNNNYTIYKLALPWKELAPVNPAVDHAVSLSIVVNDNDGNGREGYIEWGSGVGGAKDPGKFRAVEFIRDKVTLNASKTAVKPGESVTLSVYGTVGDGSPADLSKAQIVYTSDNEQIAKVDSSGTVTATGEGIANVKAAVTLNGVTLDTSIQIMVDNTPPVTTAQIGGTLKNGWYSSDATVTLNATDNLSGVDSTEYRIGTDGNWNIYTGPVVITQEGTYTIQYRSTDKAGNVEDINQQTVQIDKTPPAFNLIVNGNVLNDGGSFDDCLPLTFKIWDNLSGVASAQISVNGSVNAVDLKTQPSMDLDFAGKVGSYTVTITAEDNAGNRLAKKFTFTVTTSIDSMRNLIDRYVKAGDLGGPLVNQLTNNLNQAQHQLDIGRPEQAAKHMEDFIKHLNNDALVNNVKDNVKTILNADAEALIKLWSGVQVIVQ